MTESDFDYNNEKTHQTITSGVMISHYKIISKIGTGGMGEVYLAEDTKLNRKVCLKFLLGKQINDSSTRSQFLTEAQAAARLQHPNIITIHEVNEYNNNPYISMAYIDGQSLKTVSESKSLSIQEIIDIGIQISNGLAAAHGKGIIHRDLKPGNIMLDKSGTVKILDFGLAVLSNFDAEEDPDRTVTSNLLTNKITGTISYMAPEQLIGKKVTPLVDIFAFGVILYELITEDHPFGSKSASEVSAKILRDTPISLNEKRNNVPYDLNRIVFRCLNKNPEKRFQTALDIGNELEELLIQLKQEITVNITEKGLKKRTQTLSEESFVLTTDLVRQLSQKDSRMIGTKLAYADNGIDSDDLIIFLHGIGNDHRYFSDVLLQIPYRAVAISLYGFDYNAKIRIPITLNDHSILIHALLKVLCKQLQPSNVMMVGFSSGADHILHFKSSERFDDIHVNGLISLGCNIHLDNCFVTGKLAKLINGDENQILSTIKKFSMEQSNMNDWLLLHNYLLIAFKKFGIQTEPLRQYAADIITPFLNGDMIQFPKWYKSCIKKIPHIRFIFDTDGFETLDMMIQQHVEHNVLGDDFQEDTIVRDTVSHMVLGQSEQVFKHTNELIKLIKSEGK